MTGSLFDHRFIVVTGKGGVGKTTVAAALGLAAAKAGRYACVAELDGLWRVQELFGQDRRHFEPVPIADGVDAMSLTVSDCLDDFGRRKLKLDALVRAVFNNRAMNSFLDVIPGMHDLFQLGKLDNMLHEPQPSDPHYDLIVLDAPSTGHGLTLLTAARTMSELARVGPFYDLAHVIEMLLDDPQQSAVVAVTLPEDLPVNETLELVEQIGADRRLVEAVVANRVRAGVVPDPALWPAARDALAGSGSIDLRELADLATELVRQQIGQGEAIARLRRGLGADIRLAELPLRDAARVGPDDVRALAAILHSELGGPRA